MAAEVTARSRAAAEMTAAGRAAAESTGPDRPSGLLRHSTQRSSLAAAQANSPGRPSGPGPNGAAEAGLRAQGAARTDRPPGPAPLTTDFFDRPAEDVARDLLGCIVRSDCGGAHTSGRIVETEAYTGPDDDASHAAQRIGRTARNAPMFGPPGTAYIHCNYGMHWLLNAVTGPPGFPAAVLIRALEPVEGEAVMRRRRGRDELTNGPARLMQALAAGPDLQGHPLDQPPLSLHCGEPVPGDQVEVTLRIGISRAADRPLRFYDRRSRWISRRRPT